MLSLLDAEDFANAINAGSCGPLGGGLEQSPHAYVQAHLLREA